MLPSDGVKACHAVALPYPGRGHINPMMNLCKLLTDSKPGLLITFVVTEEWLSLLGPGNKPAAVNFATIPNVLPSEANRGSDMVKFVGATLTKMEYPFERLLDCLDHPVHIIIADTFLSWAADVGNKRNIPVASFWPMPVSVFSIFHHFSLQNDNQPLESSESGETRIDWIPGVSSIRLDDLPSIIRLKDQALFRLVLGIFSKIPRYQCLLFSSIYELESHVIQALRLSMPLYTIGPTIPYLNLELATSFTAHQTEPDYVKWLISQPPSSVLYISFGSFLPVSSIQMEEIGDGLRQSGVRFLWVARGEAERLQEKCGEMGKVVRWCEQLKVLCHPSIGGFWSHCGWNSTMEAIVAGVPIIAFPLMMDQMTIRKHLVEDWKIGIDAKRAVPSGSLLRSGEVAELVKEFMNLESKKMRRRSAELRAATMVAVSDGGSSRANLSAFLASLTGEN